MTETTSDSRYSGRKFGIAVVVLLASIIALFTGKLPPSEFVSLVPWLVGLYFGANVGQKGLDIITPKEPSNGTSK